MPTTLSKTRRAIGAGRRRWAQHGTLNRSWSQCGEDRIAAFVLEHLGIRRPVYLDLGAHHPTQNSNTYLFYRMGAQGVLVEANPALHRRLVRKRPKDTSVNVAVAPSDGTLQLHVMDASTLSTTSAGDASTYRDLGHEIVGSVTVPALSPASLLSRYLSRTPDLVSVDVEGLDLDIISAWPFENCRPPVMIIETIEYARGLAGQRVTAIGEVMEAQGYVAYADTHINTVFVDSEVYNR